MQKRYSRAIVNILIGMLAVGTIVAGTAERLAVRSPGDLTRKPRLEMRVPSFQEQVCQIDSKNCTEMSLYPPPACLLSPQLCATQGMKVVLL